MIIEYTLRLCKLATPRLLEHTVSVGNAAGQTASSQSMASGNIGLVQARSLDLHVHIDVQAISRARAHLSSAQ